jgi:magnesium transporter
MLKLRRFMGRQRDVVLRIGRQEFGLVSESDALLFRDLHDQLTRLVDLVENYREIAISILDVYLALTNNRLNETMRFLTMFTAVLMPMTVITGIYGMNFDHMPELRVPWGYPLVLGVMAVTCLLVVRFFRQRGLIGSPAALSSIGRGDRVSAASRRTGDRPTAGSTPARSP